MSGDIGAYLLGLLTLPVLAPAYVLGDAMFNRRTTRTCGLCGYQTRAPHALLLPLVLVHQRRAHGLPWTIRGRIRAGRRDGVRVDLWPTSAKTDSGATP